MYFNKKVYSLTFYTYERNDTICHKLYYDVPTHFTISVINVKKC